MRRHSSISQIRLTDISLEIKDLEQINLSTFFSIARAQEQVINRRDIIYNSIAYRLTLVQSRTNMKRMYLGYGQIPVESITFRTRRGLQASDNCIQIRTCTYTSLCILLFTVTMTWY